MKRWFWSHSYFSDQTRSFRHTQQGMLSILLVVDTENRPLRTLSDSKAFLKVYPSVRQSSPLPPSSPLPRSLPPQSPQPAQPAQPEPTQQIQCHPVATSRDSLPRSSPLPEEPAARRRPRCPTPVAHYRQHGHHGRDSHSCSPNRQRHNNGEHRASRRQREYWYDGQDHGASTSQGRSHHR